MDGGAPSPRFPAMARRLAEVLEAQARELLRLRDGMRARRECFVTGRGGLLAEGQHELEELAAAGQALERERGGLCTAIAAFLDLPPRRLSAARIAVALGEPEARDLIRAARLAREAAATLEIERRVGEALLDCSATCHLELLRGIGEAGATVRTYDPRGGSRDGDRSARIFDAKA